MRIRSASGRSTGATARRSVSGNPASVTHVYADGNSTSNYTISATATDEDGTYAAGNTVAVNVQQRGADGQHRRALPDVRRYADHAHRLRRRIRPERPIRSRTSGISMATASLAKRARRPRAATKSAQASRTTRPGWRHHANRQAEGQRRRRRRSRSPRRRFKCWARVRCKSAACCTSSAATRTTSWQSRCAAITITVLATFNSNNPMYFNASTITDIQVRTRGGNDIVVTTRTSRRR